MIAQKTRYALRSLLFLAEEQGGAPGAAQPDRRNAARAAEISRADHARPEEGRAGEERARAQGRLPAVAAGRARSRSARSCARWRGRSRSCLAPASISTRRAATATTRRPARSGAPSRSFATRARRCSIRSRSPQGAEWEERLGGRVIGGSRWTIISRRGRSRAGTRRPPSFRLLLMLLGCRGLCECIVLTDPATVCRSTSERCSMQSRAWVTVALGIAAALGLDRGDPCS